MGEGGENENVGEAGPDAAENVGQAGECVGEASDNVGEAGENVGEAGPDAAETWVRRARTRQAHKEGMVEQHEV